MAKSPRWLREALASREPIEAAATQAPVTIQPGDICIVRPMDGPGTGSRMVVALDVDEETRSFTAALATNETALLSSSDLLLEPDITGLSYRVGVLSRTAGQLWHVQADTRISRLSDEVVDAIVAAHDGIGHPLLPAMRGLPLKDEGGDLRWRQLEAEARTMQKLATDCEDRLANPIAPEYADPRLLRAEATLPPLSFFETLSRRRVSFSPSAVAWAVDNVDPRRIRAFSHHGLLSYPTAGPPISRDIESAGRDLSTEAGQQDHLIAYSLTDAASDHSGSLRVITWGGETDQPTYSRHRIENRRVELLVELAA